MYQLKHAWLTAAVLVCGTAVWGQTDPSIPKFKTGALSCLLPIKNMVCTVDMRSRFVAGMSYRYGSDYGYKDACSYGDQYQVSWNMADTNSSTFPKLPDGQYDSIYYYPYGGLISQIIVLQAANPWGEKFGTIPAIIFAYLTPITGQLDFAVCGNADYAKFYLNPAAFPPPPTPVTLQRNYVSPLSESSPNTFLGGFGAVCSQRGTGFLGGDPNTSSKYFIKYLQKVCFTKLNHVVQYDPEPVDPFKPVGSNATVEFRPCYYKKHSNGKPGSASASCVATGYVIATGKYSSIMSGTNGQAWEMNQDSRTGKMVRAASTGASFWGVLPADQGN